jgi:hypothetical protein
LNSRTSAWKFIPLKLRSKTIHHGLERLQTRIGVDGLFREFGDDSPLRFEMFPPGKCLANPMTGIIEKLHPASQIDSFGIFTMTDTE